MKRVTVLMIIGLVGTWGLGGVREVGADEVPNPLPTGVCKGLTPDSCRNVQLNGFEGTLPCPGQFSSCMVDVGIPPNHFVCQSCASFPEGSPERKRCPGCKWQQAINVYSYYGFCNGDNQNCACKLSNPDNPQPNVAFDCGAT
jgi:hypothetical protein